MNFSGRAVRVVLAAWALYLSVALTVLALHSHAPHEGGAPPCALCLGHAVAGDVAAVAVCVLAVPVLRRVLKLWLLRPRRAWVAPAARAASSRGPPVKVFRLTSICCV